MEFDQTDIQLLMLLQTDGKKTTKEYSNILGLSTTAVYERIKRLERTGVIKNYVALLDKKKIKKAFQVFCLVKLVQHTEKNVLQFEKEVIQLEEVAECYHISGDYDYILKIHLADIEAYREFMVTKLTAIPNIGSTQSSFAISEVKYTTALQV